MDNNIQNIFYQHGATGATFIVALILGFVLVILIVCFLIRKGRWIKSVSPANEQKMLAKGRKVMMDPRAAIRKGLNTIKDFSMLALDDSIVLVLALKDKLQMFREVDNMDIVSTNTVEQELESEQTEAATEASILLVHGLRDNSDISKQTADRVVGDLHTRLKTLDKKLDIEYKKDLEEVYVDLSAKNKEKCGELMTLHRKQKAEAQQKVTDVPEEDKNSYLKVLEEQQQIEENELMYVLALEQNEEAEKLRKEYAIKKRMGSKEVQQTLLDDTVAQGQLRQEQAEWLMKEHKRQQEAIHRMYDEEISQQRIVLEEKLARRKALAQMSESQENDHTDVLNTMASHQLTAINKMKRQGVLEPYDAQQLQTKVTQEMLDVETRRKAEMKRQEEELHKRLSQQKKQRLAEKKQDKEYQKKLAMIKQKLSEMRKENQDKAVQMEAGESSVGTADPESYVQGLLQLKSQHRSELSGLENEIDAEHAQELAKVRDKVNENAKNELKVIEDNLLQKLQEEGMTQGQVNKLMHQHEKEMSDLEAIQQESRKKQARKLKEDLARKKLEWEQQKIREKTEQAELRDHEIKLANKLINSQVSISEEERNRILKEHELQMVKLENSLTLNKLRQKRMLEDRLSQRKAQQLHELQVAEAKKRPKSSQAKDDSLDEDVNQRKQLMLLKKQAEQKIAILQGQKLDLDDELEQIQMEMIKERAMALREQEERLGAMITALQMERARELAKIEEQQNAINNLKANLMDDLTDRGILTTPECEQIIARHKEEQDRLNKNLETQRMKQEQIMRQKLADRLKQREVSLITKQEREMQEVIGASTNKTAAKIRKTMLMHKHMIEMEQFRNQSDREVSQFLEDMRRQYEVNKLKKIQEQELQFISGLVKVGSFKKDDLVHVLHMLFPGKTSEDIKEILEKIYNEKEAANQSAKHPESDNPGAKSLLTERVQATQLSERRMSRQGSSRNLLGTPATRKRFGSGKQRISIGQLHDYDDDDDDGPVPYRSLNTKPSYQNRPFEDDYLHGRSTPLKRDSFASYGYHNPVISEDDYYKPKPTYDEVDFVGMGASAGYDENNSPELGRKLPPLPQPKRKKKKKLLKQLAHHNDNEELL
ncbi:limbin-like [Gigantopelta aegis]|uniref:limbin-like n=1 Tax=Gigantopelta aegis TaxID=1735272 RepID=UPI001B887C90|nr:limbin-like [Gigantopelta aegis]